MDRFRSVKRTPEEDDDVADDVVAIAAVAVANVMVKVLLRSWNNNTARRWYIV
jgi:hypothetical protein